jgi:chromosome segregation ATPase
VDRPEDWEIFWKASEEIELNYHLEVEKTQSLRGDLSQAKIQIQNLDALLKKEKEAHQKSTHELSGLRSKVEKLSLLANQVRKENEKLKTVHPIRDLWTAKELEIDRLKKALGTISKGHSERAAILAIVQAHELQRDELKWLLDEAEQRLEEQSKRADRLESSLELEFEGDPWFGGGTVTPPRMKNKVPEY